MLDPQPVWAAYPEPLRPRRPEQVLALGGAGGFSGASLWRAATPVGDLCLRCWPVEHPSPERLTLIHAVLAHAAAAGVEYVPAPIRTQAGATFVVRDQRLWELTPWLPGAADFHRDPSPARLAAALQALARFHRAVESFPGRPPGERPSPTVGERRERIAALLAGGFVRLRRALAPQVWPGLTRLGDAWLAMAEPLAPRVDRELAGVESLSVPLLPCLRDVWHDHVLFTGDKVTGLIDFGSLRIETVATDLSRLLGSLVADDATAWQAGLAAYALVRPLSPHELRLIAAFDQSSVLLSGLAWLEWAFVEGRQFADRAAVEARVEQGLTRLERLRW